MKKALVCVVLLLLVPDFFLNTLQLNSLQNTISHIIQAINSCYLTKPPFFALSNLIGQKAGCHKNVFVAENFVCLKTLLLLFNI